MVGRAPRAATGVRRVRPVVALATTVAVALAAGGVAVLDSERVRSGASARTELGGASPSPRALDGARPADAPGPLPTPLPSAAAPGRSVPVSPDADARIAQLLPRRLARLHVRAGKGVQGEASILVSDLDEGRDVVGEAPGASLMPASLAKLATAVTALTALGPDTRFSTTLLVAPDGSLVLQGGGDPLLGTADLRALVRSAEHTLGRAGRVRPRRVLVDDTLYPAPRPAPGWTHDYDVAEVSPVRALTVDRLPSRDTGVLAGRALGAMWGAVTRRTPPTTVRRARTPQGSRVVARVQGRPVSAAVRAMLQVSDNTIAEMLARQVALVEGYPADWNGAQRARAAVLARLGIPSAGVRLVDGSGLSRDDRMTAYALAALLRLAVDPAHPELAAVSGAGALPVAGRTGSLRPARGRFLTSPSRCATGRIRAKTGLLRDVVGLAGYTKSSDRHLEAFVILLNGPRSTLDLRQQVDALAATVTGCW